MKSAQNVDRLVSKTFHLSHLHSPSLSFIVSGDEVTTEEGVDKERREGRKEEEQKESATAKRLRTRTGRRRCRMRPKIVANRDEF